MRFKSYFTLNTHRKSGISIVWIIYLRIETSSKDIILEVELKSRELIKRDKGLRTNDIIYHRKASEKVPNEYAYPKWTIKVAKGYQVDGEPRLKVVAQRCKAPQDGRNFSELTSSLTKEMTYLAKRNAALALVPTLVNRLMHGRTSLEVVFHWKTESVFPLLINSREHDGAIRVALMEEYELW